MSRGVEVIGLSGLSANIEKAIRENKSDVKEAVSQIGDVALLESVRRVPIDEGLLTESIQKRLGRDEDGSTVAIMIPNNAPGASYAAFIHEGIYDPGPKSLMKQSKVGVEVGRKFIVRGIESGKTKYLLILKKLLGK